VLTLEIVRMGAFDLFEEFSSVNKALKCCNTWDGQVLQASAEIN
jgi:hypothetical protein